MVNGLSEEYSVLSLCRILGLSRSAYYAYTSGKSYQPSEKRKAETKELEVVFWEHKRRYGSRRISKELKDRGMNIGRHKASSLMKKLGVKAIQPKGFIPRTTATDPSMIRSSNLLLLEDNKPKTINEVVVGDITYLPNAGEWLYLSIWMDLYSRMIVGWEVDDNMRADIVVNPMQRMVVRRKPSEGLIVHSDGGKQYSSALFRNLIVSEKFRQSMTRRDNHYDNAFAESLFSRFKAELLDEFPLFYGKRDAKGKIFEYIEGYYNTIRRHSSLDYMSPLNFELSL